MHFKTNAMDPETAGVDWQTILTIVGGADGTHNVNLPIEWENVLLES
jgi:hypothetical protein